MIEEGRIECDVRIEPSARSDILTFITIIAALASICLKVTALVMYIVPSKGSGTWSMLLHFSIIGDVIWMLSLYANREVVVPCLLRCGEKWDYCCGLPIARNGLKKALIRSTFLIVFITFIVLAILRIDLPSMQDNEILNWFLLGTGLCSAALFAGCWPHLLSFFD